MRTSSIKTFIESKGPLAYFHFLVFPLDLFGSDTEQYEAAREQRFCELTPILCWLIPVIVLLSTSTELSFSGLLCLFALEVLILTFLSIIYCFRASIGFILETLSNYAISFCIIGLLFLILAMIFAPCGIIGTVVGAVFLFQYLSKNNSNSYFDSDDDW